MDLTNIPTLVAVPFASGAGAGYINPIPVASQIPVTPGAASYTDGFVPVNFQPIASGGVPPFGKDMNGILNALSVSNRWSQAGGRYYYDATFSTAITGYPKGATLNRIDNLGAWLNTVDNNTTDPNSTSSAGWVPVRANAVAVSIAVIAGANTPTKEKLGSQVIVCTGAIASAATLVLPLTAGAVYVVHNNTTGAGTLTVIGATGSGVTIPKTVGYYVYTDGTNFYGASADVSGLYLPVGGTAVAATKLAAVRNFSLGGSDSVLTSAAVAFDGTSNVVIKADMADGALSIAKTAGLQSEIDAKINRSGDTFSGAVGFPSFAGFCSIATGNADAASYTQFNTKLSLWNGLGMASYDGSINAYYDSRAGVWDTKGGFKVNGSPVWYQGNFNPANYALLSGATFTGPLIASAGASIGGVLTAKNTAAGGISLILTGDGTTTPNKMFRVFGGVLQIVNSGNTAIITSMDDSGNWVMSGSVTATGGFQNSDRRLKKNIKPRDVQRGFALKLARMFVEWDRIADGVHDVGLIAQRVKAIASRYVIRGQKQGRKAGMLAIDKSGIALEASMDCALQLDEQAKTIRALLRRIEKLEKAR